MRGIAEAVKLELPRQRTYVFTNRVYPPVPGATGELLRQLAHGLSEHGARVIIVTSRPHAGEHAAPEGRDGPVEVIRVGVVPFTRANHLRRALSYLSLYPRLARAVARQRGVDAVISMTDPPLHSVPVSWASPRGVRRIHWAQDIYPDLAEQLGVLRPGGIAARILRAVARRTLRRQDRVVAVGSCMRDRLTSHGVDPQKLRVIRNWSPIDEAPPSEVAAMRRELGWDGAFVALYSGNLGLAHDFATLTEAAGLLQREAIRLVFAGDGARLAEVKAATRSMPNVSFLPSVPRGRLGAFLGAADAHLVTMRNDLAGMVVPSKFYGAVATGRPTVFVGPAGSEVALALESSGAGAVVRNGDAPGLAAILACWRDRPDIITALRNRAGEVAGRFTFTHAFRAWRELLEDPAD